MANNHINFPINFLIYLLFPAVFFLLLLIRRRRVQRLPPSPFALPIIGHLHLLYPKVSHKALHNLSQRYGPLIHLRLGSVPWVVASSAKIAREFLKTNDVLFCNRPGSVVVDCVTYGSQDFTSAPYGPYWKFMKKMCMSEILSSNTLDLLHPVRRDEITRFVNLLSRNARASKAVDVSSELVRVTYNIISRMTIGKRCEDDDHESNDDEAKDIMNCVQEMSKIRGKFHACDYIWFLKKLDLQGFNKKIKDVRERFDNRIEKIIEEHQEERTKRRQNKAVGDGEEVKDLLDILLNFSEGKSSQIIKLTKENIKAFLLNVFAAGVAASAVTIEWALSELINHPHIMKKATQEIDLLIGNDKRLVDESDLPNLPYLQAIVKETLRLYPAATLIKRQSSEDCEIGGYHIPANTRLFVNVLAIGRDPDYWENPLQFHPERFLHDHQGNGIVNPIDVKGQHFQCLPFGSGRRGCPATSLALQIVQTCLADMIQCFEWKTEGNGKVEMEEGNDTTLHRANPLICFPVARHA